MSIAVENLGFVYGRNPVLQNVNFKIDTGSMTALLGANGSGKSTLLRCLGGISNHFSGRVSLDGQDLSRLKQQQISALAAFLPQTCAVPFSYTALTVVLMGTTAGSGLFVHPGARELSYAKEALEKTGIAALSDRLVTELSGGELQLVMIARAVAQQSKIIILDEPTSSLDYGNQARILKQLRTLTDAGYTVLFSTHNPAQAARFCDRIIALGNKTVCGNGPPDAVLNNGLVKKIYGADVVFIESHHTADFYRS